MSNDTEIASNQAAPSQLDPLQLAGKIGLLVSLDGFRIVKASFEVEDVAADASVAGQTTVRQSYLVDDACIRVLVELGLNVGTPPGAKNPSAAFTSRFELIYGIKKPIDGMKQEVDAFARINSIYNVWPYWREFVQNSACRLGLPGLVLPLLPATQAMKLAGFPPRAPSPVVSREEVGGKA